MDISGLLRSLEKQFKGLTLDECKKLLSKQETAELKLLTTYEYAGPWLREIIDRILTEKEKMGNADTMKKDSVEDTLAQRGSRYGDFTDHAELAQGLMFRMQTFCKAEPVTLEYPDGYIIPWKDKLNNVQRQALTVIADKIARILSGDPNYDDNWHDIQGYAKLVEDRLPKPTPAPTKGKTK